jgi:DNA-binding XRE family transcriptional regulator
MKRDWLWDRKISSARAAGILADPGHRRFVALAALLLARKNKPREVFKLLSPINFRQNWTKIKKQMRRDNWNLPRITFWQAIYEKTKEKLGKKGGAVGVQAAPQTEELLSRIGKMISRLRKSKGLTQHDLARKLKISQQIISRVEQGSENISLLTLKNLADALRANLKIDL